MLRIMLAAALLMVVQDTAGQAVERLTFRALDADTGKPMEAKFDIDGTEINAAGLNLDPAQESTIGIEVTADGGRDYHSREFRLFLASYNERQITINVHLAKRGAGRTYSRGNVRQSASHLASAPDRAVALLERIRAETSETSPHLLRTQFGVMLRFNLASAHFKNCTRRGIDSCQTAADLFDELREEMPGSESIFLNEKIDEQALSTADFETQRLINIYRGAKWDLRRGAFDSAIEGFRSILDEAAQGDGDVFNRLRVDRRQVEEDLKLAAVRKAAAIEN